MRHRGQNPKRAAEAEANQEANAVPLASIANSKNASGTGRSVCYVLATCAKRTVLGTVDVLFTSRVCSIQHPEDVEDTSSLIFCPDKPQASIPPPPDSPSQEALSSTHSSPTFSPAASPNPSAPCASSALSVLYAPSAPSAPSVQHPSPKPQSGPTQPLCTKPPSPAPQESARTRPISAPTPQRKRAPVHGKAVYSSYIDPVFTAQWADTQHKAELRRTQDAKNKARKQREAQQVHVYVWKIVSHLYLHSSEQRLTIPLFRTDVSLCIINYSPAMRTITWTL